MIPSKEIWKDLLSKYEKKAEYHSGARAEMHNILNWYDKKIEDMN